MKTILITGGLGYIGSHTTVALAQAGYRLAIVDNLSNAKASVLERLKELCPGAKIDFHRADLRDRPALEKIFAAERIDAVVHFAGLKAVGESVEQPMRYYENNVVGSLALFQAMAEAQVFRLVFSSSATVYGDPRSVPIRENFPLHVTNPYGRSKLIYEQVIKDVAPVVGIHFAALRYFNVYGPRQRPDATYAAVMNAMDPTSKVGSAVRSPVAYETQDAWFELKSRAHRSSFSIRYRCRGRHRYRDRL